VKIMMTVVALGFAGFAGVMAVISARAHRVRREMDRL
jgi:hypothetical protein